MTNNTKMTKAKSILNKLAVSPLIEQVFSVVFVEVNRYLDILAKSKGIDWSIYVKSRTEFEDLLQLEKTGDEELDYDTLTLLDEWVEVE